MATTTMAQMLSCHSSSCGEWLATCASAVATTVAKNTRDTAPAMKLGATAVEVMPAIKAAPKATSVVTDKATVPGGKALATSQLRNARPCTRRVDTLRLRSA